MNLRIGDGLLKILCLRIVCGNNDEIKQTKKLDKFKFQSIDNLKQIGFELKMQHQAGCRLDSTSNVLINSSPHIYNPNRIFSSFVTFEGTWLVYFESFSSNVSTYSVIFK
jgi:hypothetical protein